MKLKIVSDTSSNLFELEEKSEQVEYASVPFTINLDGRDYKDTPLLNMEKYAKAMSECQEKSSTACPSPEEWIKACGDANNIIMVTISSSLSGSYNSALSARTMMLEDHPGKRIEIIDTLTAGPEVTLIVRKIQRLAEKYDDLDTIIEKTKAYMKTTHVLFALTSFNNFIRNGRMPKVAGMMATKFKLTGIGIGSEEGTIDVKGVVRGNKKVLNALIEDIKNRKENCKSIIIAHFKNEELANKLKEMINELWQDIEVTVMQNLALCSYYAEEGGVLVGF
ncbi:MAG: DegV family EDD domain-containing protein [Eubacterium sp.]|nr:DegV family EDD domain-containing protein [Eubacterium sp.]